MTVDINTDLEFLNNHILKTVTNVTYQSHISDYKTALTTLGEACEYLGNECGLKTDMAAPNLSGNTLKDQISDIVVVCINELTAAVTSFNNGNTLKASLRLAEFVNRKDQITHLYDQLVDIEKDGLDLDAEYGLRAEVTKITEGNKQICAKILTDNKVQVDRVDNGIDITSDGMQSHLEWGDYIVLIGDEITIVSEDVLNSKFRLN